MKGALIIGALQRAGKETPWCRKQKSKTQQLKERWENGELDSGAMTPEFIKGLSPASWVCWVSLITIDYFNERGYTLLEQGYRCTEGEADLVLLDELDDVVVMAEVKTRRVALDCNTRVFPEEAVDAQKQRRLPPHRKLLSHGALSAQGDSLRCRGCHHSQRAYRRDRDISTTRSIGRCRDGVRDVCRSRGLHPRRRGDSSHGRGIACRRRSGHPDARHSEYGGDGVTRAHSLARCALRRFEIPRSGITVNLAPGDIRKTGSGFDLPIAIAVLAADGQIPP